MNCNNQFRLGFLDGIQDRQRKTYRDLQKLARVKCSNYIAGYSRGLQHQPAKSNKVEKGNRK